MEIYNAKPVAFIDENLMRPIKVYTSVSGEIKKYIGAAIINVPGYAPMESPFAIEADSIEEAFGAYDAAYEIEVERVNDEIAEQMKEQESQIVTPKNDIII